MAESNLIQFKRGTMAALETLITNKSGIDGTFYLTVDDDAAGSTNNPSKSSRLFVGRADGSIVPVNQGIITVTSLSDLTNNINGKWHAGDYAYVTSGNILAIYDGKNWKQINAVGDDTYVTDFQMDASTDSNTGVTTITSTVFDNGTPGSYSDPLELEGANGIQISSVARGTAMQGETPAKVTITGDTYTLSRGAAASNQSEISLASTNTNNDSSVIIKGGDNVTVSTSGDNVVEIASTDFDITDISLAPDPTAGFSVSITQANDVTPIISNAIDPTIVLGTHTDDPVHFVNGQATLNVYTKDEIDAQKKALNAMTYRGTIGFIDEQHHGSYANNISSMAAPSVGDVFKIISDVSLPAEKNANGTNETLKEGDVIIANGTEDPTTGVITSGLVFDVIPAADEVDTNYYLDSIEHGVKLMDTVSQNPSGNGSFKLTAGTQITLDDNSTTTDKNVTVSHASITTNTSPTPTTATSSTTQQIGENLTLPIITSISVDNGHVTGWSIQQYEVVDTSVEITGMASSATASNNVATVSSTLSYVTPLGGNETANSTFTMSSDNLNVTATNATANTNPDVKVNFVWGTFGA